MSLQLSLFPLRGFKVLTGARKVRQSGQRCIGVGQGPGGEVSGEQRILIFQMESYSLPRRLTVVLWISRKPWWVVKSSSETERGLERGTSHDGQHRYITPLEFSAPPWTTWPL